MSESTPASVTSERAERHRKSMQKQKARVDAGIAAAQEERGIAVFLTGNGKGKTSSAFGMALRALGYGYRVGIVQFIKGAQRTGEELFLRQRAPEVEFCTMDTGFTWETQDREKDIAAAEKTWQAAERMLRDAELYLVILDELTYMLSYKYLDEERTLRAIAERPREQSVIITGRGGGEGLRRLADTVSEVKEIKHAFKAGLKARKGVEY